MNTTDDQLESTDDDELETQKALIRQSLDQIAKEVGIAMRDVHIRPILPGRWTCTYVQPSLLHVTLFGRVGRRVIHWRPWRGAVSERREPACPAGDELR